MLADQNVAKPVQRNVLLGEAPLVMLLPSHVSEKQMFKLATRIILLIGKFVKKINGMLSYHTKPIMTYPLVV
jgi:hypothetical protein